MASRGVEVPGFALHEVVGRGGFAVVHRATQLSVDRVVAIKLIETSGLGETALRRFRAETRAVGSLSWHPHVVSVYDAGILPDDTAYLAMDFLPDGTFADRVRRDGALPVDTVLAVGSQLCDALQVAHENLIVHRDVKPENVMVGRRGDAQLADFGIATLSDATRSVTGTFVGTIAYSAPELLKGQRADARSDVFSLGATLHAFFSGRSPFVGDDDETAAAVMWRVMSEAPAPLPETVPAALRALIAACLEKDPDARPTSADEVSAALAAVAPPAAAPPPPPPPTAPPPSTPPPVPRSPGRRAIPPPPVWTMDGPPIPPPPLSTPSTPPEEPPEEPPEADETVEIAGPDDVPPSDSKGRAPIVLVAVMVLLVVGLAVVLVRALGGGDGSAAADDPPTTTERRATTTTERATTTTDRPTTTTTTTPTAVDIASAQPRGFFSGDASITECTGWTADYDCNDRLLTAMNLTCVETCQATVWEADVPLTFAGETYRGEVRDVEIGTTCDGVPSRSIITIEFEVTEATWQNDRWNAVAISGQARLTAEESSCTAATLVSAFTLRT